MAKTETKTGAETGPDAGPERVPKWCQNGMNWVPFGTRFCTIPEPVLVSILMAFRVPFRYHSGIRL